MFYGDLELYSHKVSIDSWPPSKRERKDLAQHMINLPLTCQFQKIFMTIVTDPFRDRTGEHLQYFISLVIKVSKVDYMIPCPVGRSYKLGLLFPLLVRRRFLTWGPHQNDRIEKTKRPKSGLNARKARKFQSLL